MSQIGEEEEVVQIDPIPLEAPAPAPVEAPSAPERVLEPVPA